MPPKKSNNSILILMLAISIIAIGIGVLAMYKRSGNNKPAQTNQETSSTDAQNTSPAPEPETQPTNLTANWQTYTNAKYGFSLKYPENLKVGSISDNSALGTFDAPIRGFHVGPLVLVVLKDASIKEAAQNYFDASYQTAVNPPQQEADGLTVVCKVDKITNSNDLEIRSVSCNGEGGPARYAYIKGPSYDVFVDGYSKGYDNSDNGEFSLDTDYAQILSTFKF